MNPDEILRKQLILLLEKGNAHMTFNEAVADFPVESVNKKFPGADYTPWGLLEHLRRTQHDILDFLVNPDYRQPKWPDDYWPEKGGIATGGDWERTIREFRKDQKTLISILQDNSINLYMIIPHGSGQNRLKEFLTIADHNAYHIGEFAAMRQVMGLW